MTTSSQAVILKAILDFIKSGNLRPGSKPGFGHALKLSYNTIAPERLSLGGSSGRALVYRYRFSNDVPTPSVSLLTAIMDELSTDAVFGTGLPAAPGLSLQMQTEIYAVSDDDDADDADLLLLKEVDVVNEVRKLGRKVTHTQTDFLCTKTGR